MGDDEFIEGIMKRARDDHARRADIKAIWREFGGSQHGPIVETYTIAEAQFWRFVDRVTSEAERRGVERAAEICRSFSNNTRITHDMKAGIFPEKSDVQEAIANAIRAASPQPKEGE